MGVGPWEAGVRAGHRGHQRLAGLAWVRRLASHSGVRFTGTSPRHRSRHLLRLQSAIHCVQDDGSFFLNQPNLPPAPLPATATLGTLTTVNFPRVFLLLGLLPATLLAGPVVEKTTWRELPAFRLSDGRTEAVVVPQLGGRCVSYRLLGGRSWLWTGEPGSERRESPLLWGGDKTYPGPHSGWALILPKTWPPPEPDFQPHEVVSAPGALLATLSPVWPGYGARVQRAYAFADNGDLVITHTLAPVPGSQVVGAVWQIAQTIPTDSVYVPLHPRSPYKDNVFWFGGPKPAEDTGAQLLSPSLLRLQPKSGIVFKLGAHPKVPALAAVKDGFVFVMKADPQDGQYPEGAAGAGLSVEVYHHHLPGPGEYTELELLSPLRRMDRGAQLVTRWNIHALPKTPPDEPQAVARLLGLE